VNDTDKYVMDVRASFNMEKLFNRILPQLFNYTSYLDYDYWDYTLRNRK